MFPQSNAIEIACFIDSVFITGLGLYQGAGKGLRPERGSRAVFRVRVSLSALCILDWGNINMNEKELQRKTNVNAEE